MSKEFRETIIEKIRDFGLDHDILKYVTIIKGIVINETSLRIGKGHGELGEVDIPILKDHRNIVYIPGSSLKGVLRSFSEAIARGSGDNKICTPHNQNMCSFGAELLNYILQQSYTSHSINDLINSINYSKIEEISKRRLGEELSIKIQSSIKNMLDKTKNNVEEFSRELLKTIEEYSPCVVCRVFGNQALASKITVFDLYPANRENIKIYVRTRVSIDRFRDAARSKALFEYEFVPPGHRWDIKIELKNINLANCVNTNNDVCRLLLTILNVFAREGISIGGMKSIGYGVIRLVPEETKIIVYEIKNFTINKTCEETLSNFMKFTKC